MLLAALVLALATPAPEPTDLKEIGRVHSSAFCTTIVKTVKPYVYGTIANDRLISDGEVAFMGLGHDLVTGNKVAIALGKNRANRVADGLAKNLTMMQRLLGDFPPEPNTDDNRQLLALKADLESVAASQQLSLNALGGMLDTAKMGQMKADRDANVDLVTGTNGTPHTMPNPEEDDDHYLTAAMLPSLPGVPVVDIRTVMDSTLIGHTLYGQAAGLVYIEAVHRAVTEDRASAKIIAAVAQCGGQGGGAAVPASPPPTPEAVP